MFVSFYSIDAKIAMWCEIHIDYSNIGKSRASYFNRRATSHTLPCKFFTHMFCSDWIVHCILCFAFLLHNIGVSSH